MLGNEVSFAEVMNLSLLTTALAVAVFFGRLWMNRQDRYRLEERQDRRREADIRLEEFKATQRSQNDAERRTDINSGGYIVIDMPDDQKRLFHDVLKGFEEFAALKGYSISFSLDSSVPDKVAFKFTILDKGVTVSTQTVKNDLQEYITKVQSGDDLSDLPIVIPDVEHATLLLAMRNRINFLQHTYTAQKNVLDIYERVLRSGDGQGFGIRHIPTQNFYLQSGGNMSPRNYTAIDSERIVQGDSNEVDQSIYIAESFNKKKQQIDNVDGLIAALTAANTSTTEDSKRAIVNLEKVKDELTTEIKPDRSRVKKWLQAAGSSIKALALGKDVIELAEKMFADFQLPF